MISDYDFRANKTSELNSDDSTGEGEI
ncbi:hypothetical protein (partial), partial [Candidatus Ichthyocystis hellenicum]